MGKLKVGTGPSGGYSPSPYYKEPKMAVIDIKNEEDLEKWQEVLHLSRQELLAAINDFGPLVRDIRRGLRSVNQDEAA